MARSSPVLGHVSPSVRTIWAFSVTIFFAGLASLAWVYAAPAFTTVLTIGMMISAVALLASCIADLNTHDDHAVPALIERSIRQTLTSRAFHAALARTMYQQPTERRGHEVHEDGEGRLITCHPQDKCEGEGCPIHHPSEHHMAAWPWISWTRPLISRRCQHGTDHPDPDSLAYVWRFVDVANVRQWDRHECCEQQCCGAPRVVVPDATGETEAVPESVQASLSDAADAVQEMARLIEPAIPAQHGGAPVVRYVP
jgi:hypothetical protein